MKKSETNSVNFVLSVLRYFHLIQVFSTYRPCDYNIDIGDILPVSQRPYNLPLIHKAGVQGQLETLESLEFFSECFFLR